MTSDFIADAEDSLDKDKENTAFILIAAHFGSTTHHTHANVPTREGLEWMKRRFEELCERLEEQYETE